MRGTNLRRIGFNGCCDCDCDDNRVAARGSESLILRIWRHTSTKYFSTCRYFARQREYAVNQGLTECTEGNYRNKVG